MKVQSHLFASMAALAITCTAVACTEQDEEAGKTGDLAQIQVDESTITFARMRNGGIAVSEVGPAVAPSRLSYYASLKATPLEVFLAVAPNEDVPLGLEIHHASLTDADPRELAESEFRSFSSSVGSADCTYTGDYTNWFEPTRTAFNPDWSYSYYVSGSSTSHDTSTKYTSSLITHVCNVSEAGGSYTMTLGVYKSGFSSFEYQINDIDIDDRGVIYVLGNTQSWISNASNDANPGDQTNYMRHGMMAP